MLDHFIRELQIRRALKAIARQQVTIVHQPGNIQVIEYSPPNEEWFELGVRTCQIRGWVEILHENLPTSAINFKGEEMALSAAIPKIHYRLTEGGWAVINRSHGWVMATFLVSSVSLIASIVSIVLAMAIPPK